MSSSPACAGSVSGAGLSFTRRKTKKRHGGARRRFPAKRGRASKERGKREKSGDIRPGTQGRSERHPHEQKAPARFAEKRTEGATPARNERKADAGRRKSLFPLRSGCGHPPGKPAGYHAKDPRGSKGEERARGPTTGHVLRGGNQSCLQGRETARRQGAALHRSRDAEPRRTRTQEIRAEANARGQRHGRVKDTERTPENLPAPGKRSPAPFFLLRPAGRPRFPAAFVSDGVFFRPGGGLFPRRSALLCDGAPLLRGRSPLPCCGALFGGGSLLFRSRLFRGGRFGFRGVGK